MAHSFCKGCGASSGMHYGACRGDAGAGMRFLPTDDLLIEEPDPEAVAQMKAQAEAYHSTLCPGCKDVESVSSSRYSHEDLCDAENVAAETGRVMAEEAILSFGEGYLESLEGEPKRVFQYFLNCIYEGEHRA